MLLAFYYAHEMDAEWGVVFFLKLLNEFQLNLVFGVDTESEEFNFYKAQKE
jgi:hypothetical protein